MDAPIKNAVRLFQLRSISFRSFSRVGVLIPAELNKNSPSWVECHHWLQLTALQWLFIQSEIQSNLFITQPSQFIAKQKGRKEMFYLTMHSTHFIYGYNGVGHMVKDHSDSERGNPLPPHGLLFPTNSKVLLYAPSHRQDSTYHSLCYTSRGALAGTRNSSMGSPHEGSIQ